MLKLTCIDTYRDCTGGTFYTLEGNQYCTDQCETVTMCNTATVTQDHLNVSCHGNI